MVKNKQLQKGDYVLATKYGDGDPQDHWCVGFFDSMLGKTGLDRYNIVDFEGKLFRGNGFRRAKKISKARGEFLLKHAKEIEMSYHSVWWWVRCKITVAQPARLPNMKMEG